MASGEIGRGPAVLALGGAVVLGAALRFIGLAYGLPAVYNPDEVAIMNRALAFATGNLNPHNFVYPTFYFYVLFVWEGLAFLSGYLAGLFDSAAAFERSFFVDPTFIYVAGRVFSVLCGVATIVATYMFAGRVAGRTAAVTAAALVAVAPLAVRDAHYVKHDVPVTLLIVLTHVVLAQPVLRAREWVLSGSLAGLAMSTHYYAVFLVVPLAMSAVIATGASGVGRPVGAVRALVLAGVASAVALLMTSPFLFADPALTFRDMVANRQIVMDRVTGTQGWLGSGSFYLRWMVREAAGAGTFLLALGGLAALPLLGWRRAWLVIAFPSVFLVFISNTYPASRYLNAVLPFVAVLGGMAVAWLVRQGRVLRVAGVTLALLASIEGAVASLKADIFFRATDTRSLALGWIEAHVPPGTTILVEPYSVPLRMSRAALAEALTRHLGSADRASIKFQRIMALDPYPEPAYRAIYLGDGGLDVDRIYVSPSAFDEVDNLAPLHALSVTYVIRKRYNGGEPARASFDQALEREGQRVAVFSPYARDVGPEELLQVAPFLHNTDARIDTRLERPGPTIEIWTISQ